MKKVKSYLSNICPYCFYVHRPEEGTSSMDVETGRVDFACVKCGKSYYWMQYHIDAPVEGKYISKELYAKLKE